MAQERQAASGTYDPVARTYVERYLHELASKPFDPYPEVEYQGRRVYLLARKPETV